MEREFVIHAEKGCLRGRSVILSVMLLSWSDDNVGEWRLLGMYVPKGRFSFVPITRVYEKARLDERIGLSYSCAYCLLDGSPFMVGL